MFREVINSTRVQTKTPLKLFETSNDKLFSLYYCIFDAIKLYDKCLSLHTAGFKYLIVVFLFR